MTPESVASELTNILDSAPERKLLGARLGALLKARHPDFAPVSFGCRSLRHFIKTYAPKVEEQGHSGPDIVYGLTRGLSPHQTSFSLPAPAASYVPLPTSAFNWRAFTSPSYPYVLAANRDTGDLKVFPLGSEIPATWVALPKPDSGRHLEIARSFVSTLDEHQRPQLEGVLNGPKWFLSFTSVARNAGMGALWGTFRSSQLRVLFDEALKELGVPVRKSAPRSVSRTRSEVAARSEIVDPHPAISRDALVKVVCAVIADLSDTELRELRLPLGKILDHLHA